MCLLYTSAGCAFVVMCCFDAKLNVCEASLKRTLSEPVYSLPLASRISLALGAIREGEFTFFFFI